MGVKQGSKGGHEATLPLESHGAEMTVDNEPGESPKKQTAFQAYVRVFSYSTATDKVLLGISLVAALGSGVAVAMLNLVMGDFLTVMGDFSGGGFEISNFLDSVSKYALYFVYLGIARLFLIYIFSVLSSISAYRITRNIRRSYLRAALSQEIAFFDEGEGGAIAAQATSNGALIQAGIAEKLGQVFQTIATFIGCFVIAFVVHAKLTAIIICIVPTIVIVVGVTSALDTGIESQILNVHAQAGSYTEGVLGSVRTVKAFGLRPRLVETFDKYLSNALHLGLKKNILYGIMVAVQYFTTYAGMGLAFWQGINMYAKGEVDSIGTVFTVLMSVIIASTMLSAIAPNIMAFTRAATAASQLFSLIDRESKINPFDVGGDAPENVTGAVELRGVNFAYPTRPGTKVLDDFSLHIPAGKVTALVGASGSGKSTVVGLLERWYNPNSGSITLDGVPIEKLNLRWLRTNVRLVQQEPVLFNGTVFNNISNGLVGTK
ncbi:ATP-binding cassette sub-family B member 5 [Ilyonectria robusta]